MLTGCAYMFIQTYINTMVLVHYLLLVLDASGKPKLFLELLVHRTNQDLSKISIDLVLLNEIRVTMTRL